MPLRQSVEMDQLHTNGNHLLDYPVKTIIDSGTSLLTGPSDLVDNLAQTLGAYKLPWMPSAHFLACERRDSLPDLVFVLGGRDFSLTPAEYTIDLSGNSDEISRESLSTSMPCMLAFTALDVRPYDPKHNRLNVLSSPFFC